ncbi:hypothetical protein A2U01_0097295, partial [Trifolium medium]|nr:hypothetical protein [Trifolium medium]
MASKTCHRATIAPSCCDTAVFLLS